MSIAVAAGFVTDGGARRSIGRATVLAAAAAAAKVCECLRGRFGGRRVVGRGRCGNPNG